MFISDIIDPPQYGCSVCDETLQVFRNMLNKYPTLATKIVKFPVRLPYYYRLKIGNRDYYFCHAGINPAFSLEKQTPDDLLWIREEFFNNYNGDAVVIVGHTPVQDFDDVSEGVPLRLPNQNILLMDTLAYSEKGKLSCVDILSGEYRQSNSDSTLQKKFVC